MILPGRRWKCESAPYDNCFGSAAQTSAGAAAAAERNSCAKVGNAGGRYADNSVRAIRRVEGGGGGNLEKLPQCGHTGQTQLPGPPAPPPPGCTHNLPAGRLTAVAAGKLRLGSPAVQGCSSVIYK